MKKYHRHSAKAQRDRRWPALRMQAKRRDDFRCVSCGARGRLEVDHVRPVRTHPELAFDINNLQCLCARCHSRKTATEVGIAPLSPQRRSWRDLLQENTPCLSQ